jgi:RNA polymerase sigma-70 factor (ECF subfamily)
MASVLPSGDEPPSQRSDGPDYSDLVTSRHVDQALRGDRASLGWVVTRFTPLLKAQAAWRLGPALRKRYSAEDIVAEAWLVVLRRLGDLVNDRGRSTPRLMAFLGTTVLNITNRRIDEHLRRTASHPPPSAKDADDDLRDLADTVTGAVTNAVRNESAAAIDAALAQLADKDREIIILRIAEGLSNNEAALQLGEAPNTVSHRYQRALEKLRKALPESFFEDFDRE